MPVDLRHPDRFTNRHIGPDAADTAEMLRALGLGSLDALCAETVPASIRLRRALDLPAAESEFELLQEVARIGTRNQVFRSYIGLGYADCITPPVILRNIVENPGWYTQYTPYQAEISQGRLEALLNFQTMIADLTALPMANASLLDEATAAAEAMHMIYAVAPSADEPGRVFLVSDDCHPQTIEVVRTRAEPLGWAVKVGDPMKDLEPTALFGALLQYPRRIHPAV